MINNTIAKKPNSLSPTWTIVLATVTLLGMYLALPQGNSNFYITAFFMVLASLAVLGAAVATDGIKGYGYPKRMTLRVVAWRYFLTQFLISILFTLAPLTIGWEFDIEVKRYLIMHSSILALFGTAAVLLVTGKRKMDDAKLADFNNWCIYVHGLRERMLVLPAGKEQRALILDELDKLCAALSCALPVYSESLAGVEDEIKREFALLDECLSKLDNSQMQDVESLANICKGIKKLVKEREQIIQTELTQMEDEQ